MPIRFRSPDDQPYGCFHPRSRYHGFRDERLYWSSVSQFCLAQRLARPEDRERVRSLVRVAEESDALAPSLPTIDGWEAQVEEVHVKEKLQVLEVCVCLQDRHPEQLSQKYKFMYNRQ
jgi:hypothetical protein